MAAFVHRFTQDLQKPVLARYGNGLTFTGDARANVIEVEVLDGGAAASLSGTVAGAVIRADGNTVALSGALSGGNICSVTLPQAAYAVPGPIAVFITLVSGSVTTTLLKAIYTNDASNSGSVVDPGTIIPDVNALLAAIESAVASVPADYGNLLASLASTFSSATAYQAGNYVWYDGSLYRFKTYHAAGTWSADDVTACVIGDDLSAVAAAVTNAANMGAAIADGQKLLSSALSNSSSTSSGISYSLSGNVLTASGTASAASAFTWTGGTNTAPPSWLTLGKPHIVRVEITDPNIIVRLQGKQTSDTSLHTLAQYTQSGYYAFTPPADLTAFRIISYVASGKSVNGTVTLEISGAITAFDLSDGCAAIPDGTDFDTLTTPGVYKVTSNTHASTMSHMPISIAGKLIVLPLSQAERVMQVYVANATAMPIAVRYYGGSTWTDWDNLAKMSVVSDIQTRIRPCQVVYESGSYQSGAATERLRVYIPASYGYILYDLYHFDDDTNNCNDWQVHQAYHVKNDLSAAVNLSANAEWECALRLNGRDDFSGGHTHGDEIMTAATLLLDGAPVTISSLTTLTEFRTLQLIRTSKMYDPADHTTAIADHGVKYTFDKSGLRIDQSIKWLVAAQLANCFLCMFPPAKNRLDRAVVNTDFSVIELPSENDAPLTTVTKPNADAVTMWDTSGGFSAVVSVPVYPRGLTGGDQLSISDNSGNSYNKVYFKVCGGGNSTVGELWKSTSLYKIDYSDTQ